MSQVKIEYYIRGRGTLWVRGPYSSLAARQCAIKMAIDNDEAVDIQRVVISTQREICRTVTPKGAQDGTD